MNQSIDFHEEQLVNLAVEHLIKLVKCDNTLQHSKIQLSEQFSDRIVLMAMHHFLTMVDV